MRECFVTMEPQKLMDRMLGAIFYNEPMTPALLAMCVGRWTGFSARTHKTCTHPMSPSGDDLNQACAMLMGRKIAEPSPAAQSIHSQLIVKLG